MTTVEAPLGFVISEECRKAAWQNGYRRSLGEEAGWTQFGSTTARGSIHLAASGPEGPWFLALDHSGVIEELKLPPDNAPGPGLARYGFASLGELYNVLSVVYNLGLTLPEGPLEDFRAATGDLPGTTQVERLVIQRVGQDIFRDRLMTYWQRRCPLTGITNPALLRASHIVPWKDCPDDAERLNIFNGLLLSALWDAAFDAGLTTFNDEGQPQYSPALGEEELSELRWYNPVPLTDRHRERLAWHRAERFVETRAQ